MTINIADVLAAEDDNDIDKFVSFLAPSAVLHFGNREPIVGRAAVKAAVIDFLGSIERMIHHVQQTWSVGNTLIAVVNNEYHRKDGAVVVVPNANVLTIDSNGLITEWRSYLDISPLYANRAS